MLLNGTLLAQSSWDNQGYVLPAEFFFIYKQQPDMHRRMKYDFLSLSS